MDKWSKMKKWLEDNLEYIKENQKKEYRPDWEIEWDKAQKMFISLSLTKMEMFEKEGVNNE